MAGGEIQRAQLFADVDELIEWKKAFMLKQGQLIEWQLKVQRDIKDLEERLKTTLRGCQVLMRTDEVLGNRLDIVNKRLRKLEERQ